MSVQEQRVSQGQMSFHAGSAAENAVARDFQQRGYQFAHGRWRGAGGEIDLIVENGDGFVFVEVKQSKSFAQAAVHIGERQMRRIYAAAEEFLGAQSMGSLSAARFDVALVDGQGGIHIIENAFGAM